MFQRQTGHTPAVWFICDVNIPNVDGAHAVCRVHLLTIVIVKADRVDVAMVILNLLHQLKSQPHNHNFGSTFSFKVDHCALQSVMPYL